MQLNAFFPSLDIGSDPAKIRDWAQAAEDLGYAYIEVPDHVFGATARDGWVPLYGEKESFHETFVTLGFLAAVTKSIGLSSGVLIAPQRQTGVIAKQAVEVDLLSGGRLRLGRSASLPFRAERLVLNVVPSQTDAPGRTSPGAASPVVGESREL
jgi:alkanesulfonate monooxygenase SsuD/methylene tetrahydromethanopterin reductase-like flavin-dependent oxidoreductase (luciferase family)